MDEEFKLIGKILMLADGLSTNVYVSFYTQIVDEKFVEKYMRVEKLFKKYLLNHYKNPKKNILVIFQNAYVSIWKELLDFNYQLDIPIPTNMKEEVQNRIELFENWQIGELNYVG